MSTLARRCVPMVPTASVGFASPFIVGYQQSDTGDVLLLLHVESTPITGTSLLVRMLNA
jgi:hypothetical protein